jgi:hypothetical protein
MKRKDTSSKVKEMKGKIWKFNVRKDMELKDKAWNDKDRHGMAWHDKEMHDMAWKRKTRLGMER